MNQIYNIHVSGFRFPNVTDSLNFNNLFDAAWLLLPIPGCQEKIKRIDLITVIDGDVVATRRLSVGKTWDKIREYVQ